MNRQPILQTDRLIIRPLVQTDYEALYQIASDPAVWEQHPIHDRWRREVFDAFFADGMASGGASSASSAGGSAGRGGYAISQMSAAAAHVRLERRPGAGVVVGEVLPIGVRRVGLRVRLVHEPQGALRVGVQRVDELTQPRKRPVHDHALRNGHRSEDGHR